MFWAREGPSHGHRGSAQNKFVKIGPAVPEIHWRTDRHTNKLIAILRSLTGPE